MTEGHFEMTKIKFQALDINIKCFHGVSGKSLKYFTLVFYER